MQMVDQVLQEPFQKVPTRTDYDVYYKHYKYYKH